MPSTYTLISSNVLGSSAASVTFSAIPSTYTDLVLRMSVRTNRAAVVDRVKINLNGLTTGIYSVRNLYGDGSAPASNADSAQTFTNYVYVNGNTSTSSTYSNTEMYLPNYLSATNKPLSIFGVSEENTSTSAATYIGASAHLVGTTSTISSIVLAPLTGTNFNSGSSFYLYGIKNS